MTAGPTRDAQAATPASLTVKVPWTLTPEEQVSDPHPLISTSPALGKVTLELEPTVTVPLVKKVVPVKLTFLGLRSSQLTKTLAWVTTNGAFMEHEAPGKSSGKTV